MLDNLANLLHSTVVSVCPIHGISIGRRNDKSTWRVDFKDEATLVQQQAARDILLAFDVMLAEREQAIEETRKAKRAALLEKLIDAEEEKII
jgi:hypothetical protein